MTDHQVQIADLIEELCDPRQHREQRWTWSDQRNKVKLPDHTTIQPGLLAQLYEAVEPILGKTGDNQGGSRGVARSTPPLRIEALDRYLEIANAVDDWCEYLHIELANRPTTQSRLRALAGADTTSDQAAELLADLHRWRAWASTLTGWQTIYQPNRAYCPVLECGAQGTLRINLTRKSAICTACRSWWDEATIGLLADHIANSTDGAS